MEMTYKTVSKIRFPVFILYSNDIIEQDGLVYCGHYVLDDKNQIGETLGSRRLQSPYRLFNLNGICSDFRAMITSKKSYFIDSNGMIFNYRKTRSCKVICHKIQKIHHRDTYTLLKISSYNPLILVDRPPPSECGWVNMLYIGRIPSLLYSYSVERSKPFRRII